jgi:predicted membrane protein
MNGIDLSQLFAFDKILTGTSFNFLQIFISLAITFLIAMFIYFIYKKTYNGVLYSKNFNLTLVIIALIVDALMIGISGNLVLSLGLVGALSIVRFRTAVKDPKDTAFIFWAISIGVINGVGYYQLSILASIFIALVLFVLSRSIVFEPSYILILKYVDGVYPEIEKVLQSEFQKYFVRTDSRKSNVIEKVIEVKMKKGNQENALRKIHAIENLESCNLLSSNGEFSE